MSEIFPNLYNNWKKWRLKWREIYLKDLR